MTEKAAISRRRGKWSDNNVPHKGWSLQDSWDLGEPSQTCEMCETQGIRFVHLMNHPKWHEELECGCVCAERMSEDYRGRIKGIETSLRSRANSKTKFPNRKGWTESARGNNYISIKGRVAVVKQTGWGWRASVCQDEAWHSAGKLFNSEEQARKACFDLLEKLGAF